MANMRFRSVRPLFYADDDVQTFKESNADITSLRNSVHFINLDVRAIIDWSFRNGLSLNGSKTNFIIFGLADALTLGEKFSLNGLL